MQHFLWSAVATIFVSSSTVPFITWSCKCALDQNTDLTISFKWSLDNSCQKYTSNAFSQINEHLKRARLLVRIVYLSFNLPTHFLESSNVPRCWIFHLSHRTTQHKCDRAITSSGTKPITHRTSPCRRSPKLSIPLAPHQPLTRRLQLALQRAKQRRRKEHEKI